MALKTILCNFLNLLENNKCLKNLGKDVYELEFQKLKALTDKLKQDPEFSCKHGAQEINRCKNRYKDILPYDITRVILTEDSEIPGSDYINANYIKGASNSMEYIASQGPLPNTVVDFWRMIWECEVKIVIMACNERESGKQKCECYWPEKEKECYGNIFVEILKTQFICPDFLVRTFKAVNNNKERLIYQFHYTTWPDHGVPESVEPILQLIQLVRKFQTSEAVPILVHCSAGCGRTGTICSIDYVWRLMKMGKLTESFNLFEIISKMRKQRIAMVQTKEQYILVHRAVAALFEHQIELIDNHIYENLDESGQPLLKNAEEINICGKINETEDIKFSESHNEYCFNDYSSKLKEIPLNENSEETIQVINNTKFEDENQATNSINCVTNENNYDQNVNFTISLPLNSTKKQSDNLSVSTTLIYNENRIMVNLKEKETENIPESSNEYHNTKTESSYDLKNFADSKVETISSYSPNENKLMKLSEDKCTNLEYKNSDIEDIFLQILNDDDKQPNEKLDDKFKTNTDISSNLSCSLEKVDKSYEEIIDKSPDEIIDQNSVNLFERDVLHNLTSDSVIASRQRYMCLVNECEQSFSEIERLLEEKNFENSKNISSKNNNKESLKFDQSISNDDEVSKPEEPFCSFKVNELIQRNSTNLQIKFDEITNNNAVEPLHSKSEMDDSKNNCGDIKTAEQIIDDDKFKYLEKRIDDNSNGIEEVLMKNQKNNEEAIEYIDSVTQEAIIVNELPQNHHKINYSVSEGISNFENYENSNFEIGDKSLKNLNYKSKLTPCVQVEKNSENFKSNLARKRTGKIFDTEDDQLNFKQERSSSFFANNYYIADNDKYNVSGTSHSDNSEINEYAKNDFSLSNTCEYENFTENSINEKSSVAQKPSIAKLKALFEKSVVHDLPKHKHKHPLSRSHSHHITQNKSAHSYSSNERTILKPTIFNKVSKIFHTPSYEEPNEICSNKLNIHKNLKESESALISSNLSEQFLKDNESRSQWYDGAKHSFLEIKPNVSFNSEDKLLSNKSTKNEAYKRDSNAIEIGCLDISSLMSSVISDEQTVSQTQWYEENNRNSIVQCKEIMHKENLSQNISEERNSEECNEKNKICILLDSSEENELSRLSDTNIKISPEIPNKKKFQDISFHSFQDNIQIKKQNFSDKLENTTKWYFKKENSDIENNNDQVENINNDNLNVEVNLESYDDLLTASPQENIHNLSPNSLIKSNLDNFFNKQPPHLPPKKKCDNPKNHTNWYLKGKSLDLNNTENINDSDHVAYANVIKAKNGSLTETEHSKNQIFYKLDEEKTDLYMNVNATTRKNIEQIENSLQQHPRGAIIDLTSRQSFANEQQINNCNEQNVKELKKTFSSDFKGKLKEYQKIILNPSKKPKGYETIWPQKCNNENNQSCVNNSEKKLSINKNLRKHQENLELSQKICDEYKVKPQPKPRSLVSDKHISKSNSSSVLFQKHLNVKNSVSDFNRFKETSVNKVVCELNSILNVLTTRPFKSSKPETSVISSSSSSSETSQKVHPSAPPRRKLKQDSSDCQFSNSEIYSSSYSTCNTTNSNSINEVESKGQQLSKSTTLPNINYLHSKELCQISKENKVSDNESARCIKDSKKLHSVYENIDTTQSNISHLENQETSDNFKNKMHKLKHSSSDASVFSVLRNTKYKNKLATSSAIKTENKLNDKRKQVSKLNEESKMVENKSGNSCDIPKQFIQTITKNEKRSVDDMDIFPVAPPRSRRHGPTLKSVSEMEKFTKSLDEVGSKFPALSVDALKSSKFSFQKKFQNNNINSNASGYCHSVSTGIGCSADKFAKTDKVTNPISRTKSLKIIPLQKVSDGSVEIKPFDKGGRSIQTDIDSSSANQYTKLSQGLICKNQES